MKNRSGKEIQRGRLALRIKQTHFAAFCDVEPEHMSRIENGKVNVPGYVNTILTLLERDQTAILFLMEGKGLL